MNTQKNKTAKHPGGRPSLYKPEYAKQALKLCLLGAIDKEMAYFFGVARSTLNLWKQRHSEFSDTIRRGKLIADANVAESLYKCACGYNRPEYKIFQYKGKSVVVPTIKRYPPDVTACIFWLKNRQPEKWRDKPEVKAVSEIRLHFDKDAEDIL